MTFNGVAELGQENVVNSIMNYAFKTLAARFPERVQQGMKRQYFRWQIRTGSFRTWEPEYELLPDIVSAGDWVLDIGANIGHYTMRLSHLVGELGRVISFEPVPHTFELLVGNVAIARSSNVTLINAAASDTSSECGIKIPTYRGSDIKNYYEAKLSNDESGQQILCISIDSLNLPHAVRVVKIDAEGHEPSVLRGMKKLIERDHPTLVVEGEAPEVAVYLAEFGYVGERALNSPNVVWKANLGG